MVKKEVKYEKEFASRKSDKNPSIYDDIISEEEYLIQEEFAQKFSTPQCLGFDGKQMYSYEITSTLRLPDTLISTMPYKVIYIINKMGEIKDIKEPSDLENFLLEKGFKKIDKEEKGD